MAKLSMSDAFTIDVEDWFHILETEGTPEFAVWDSLPSRIERNLRALLAMLFDSNVKATLFTLGWVARRFPGLLREAVDQGHEIASHGNAHRSVRRMTRSEFREDIRGAKSAIEDAIGHRIFGFRAPGFSITEKTLWAFDEIIDAGYTYDSSVFPARHGHGGIPDAPRHPWIIGCSSGRLVEFPISTVDTPVGPQCLFGGGYLRLFPFALISVMANRVRREGRGIVWYIHPREIDPSHPRLAMSLSRRFRSYVNLRGTEPKLRAILRKGNFSTLGELAAGITDTNGAAQRVR